MESTEVAAPSEESSAGSAESTEQTQESGPSKAEETAKAQARKLGEQDLDALVTVNINGETREMPLRDVIKINQLENVSQKKMQEAAKLRQQAEQFFRLAKSNPREFLKQTGIDPYEFAESTLAEKFEMMNLSPEQKRLMELEKENKSYKEKEKEDRQKAEQEQLSRYEQQELAKLDQEIGEAWKESGLPKTKYMAAQIAARLLSASKRGENLTAKEAAARVKEEFKMSTREVIGQLDAESILDLFGKDIMKKIRDYDVKRVTGKASQAAQGPSAKPVSQGNKVFKSEHEWREHLAKIQENLTD